MSDEQTTPEQMAARAEAMSKLPPLRVPSPFPNIVFTHFGAWDSDTALPVDGSWSVTLEATDTGMQRVHFRTFHAAAHYAERVAGLTDWTVEKPIPSDETERNVLFNEMAHAERHAREVDATWPAGAWVPMEGGPSILDDTGTFRWFSAPVIKWAYIDGRWQCPVCGEGPIVHFEWMDRPETQP